MIYLGGDMLSIGQQMRREWEKQELQRLGFKVYAHTTIRISTIKRMLSKIN